MFRKLFSLRKQIHLLVLFCIHACSFQRKRRILIVQFQRHIKTQVKESILYISSYTDANFKMNVIYRKYSSDVPEYLRNRPRKLVKHCLKKISLANSADLSALSIVKNVVFSIKSFENNESKMYMVSFEDDVNMPQGTCLDLESSCYLCKHFFTVFRKFRTWQWDGLSPLYIN